MNREEIIDAYLFLRENNHSIPDSTLNFMKDVALRELERIETTRICFSCQHDGLQGIFCGPCTGCGPDNELNNFKVKT